jgi:hypothetical protein
MRHHEQRARELGAAIRRNGITAVVNYVSGFASEAASHDRSAKAQARAQVAIGEFVLATGGA